MTSREFAKLMGVSQSTVSRALNNSPLVPEEKRKLILAKAREVGFELNSHAKSLRTQRTGTIGILFPKHFVSMSANMMLAHLYDCIQNEMHHYNYDIMVVYYESTSEDFSSFERIIRTRKVDGFLVLRMELSHAEMCLIEEYQVPCVFLMNAGSKIRPQLNYLFSDSEYGGYIAGRYFGGFPDYHKLFITVHEELEDAERRLEGYRRGLESCGCPLEESDILFCRLSIEDAYNCILQNRDRLSRQKTAIFAYSDTLGVGIINACRELGLCIPEQVQIISMDDIPLAQQLHPRLSTLHINVEEMVPRSCRLLMEGIDRKEGLVQEWIRPRLILRDTTVNREDHSLLKELA